MNIHRQCTTVENHVDNVENPSPVWFLPNPHGPVTMYISLYNNNQTEFMVSGRKALSNWQKRYTKFR